MLQGVQRQVWGRAGTRARTHPPEVATDPPSTGDGGGICPVPGCWTDCEQRRHHRVSLEQTIAPPPGYSGLAAGASARLTNWPLPNMLFGYTVPVPCRDMGLAGPPWAGCVGAIASSQSTFAVAAVPRRALPTGGCSPSSHKWSCEGKGGARQLREARSCDTARTFVKVRTACSRARGSPAPPQRAAGGHACMPLCWALMSSRVGREDRHRTETHHKRMHCMLARPGH